MSQLTAEQLRDTLARLDRGEPLDPSLRDILFPPEKREYELVYEGKKRREDVLADTLAVPLQPVRTFAPDNTPAAFFEGDEWHNRLIFGDNLQAMRSLLELKKQGQLRNADGSDGVRLIYIDPPFATKQEFRGNQDQKAYQDKILGAKFIEAMRQRLIMMHELLSDDGAIYLHLDTKKVHHLKLIMDELFGEHRFINEVIWKRSSTTSSIGKIWKRAHESLLFYTKSDSYVFNFQYKELSEASANLYDNEDETGTYQLVPLLVSGKRKGTTGQIWRGIDPNNRGRAGMHWVTTPEKLEAYDKLGLVVFPAKKRRSAASQILFS